MGFLSEVHDQLIAFVAASIIAPGLEPIAKIPLGLVLRRKDVLWVGLKASVAGYLILMISAAGAFAVMLYAGEATADKFLSNPVTESFLEIKLTSFMVSTAAASASIIMYLAYRRNVIAGPLIALILIPATSAVGMKYGRWRMELRLGNCETVRR